MDQSAQRYVEQPGQSGPPGLPEELPKNGGVVHTANCPLGKQFMQHLLEATMHSQDCPMYDPPNVRIHVRKVCRPKNPNGDPLKKDVEDRIRMQYIGCNHEELIEELVKTKIKDKDGTKQLIGGCNSTDDTSGDEGGYGIDCKDVKHRRPPPIDNEATRCGPAANRWKYRAKIAEEDVHRMKVAHQSTWDQLANERKKCIKLGSQMEEIQRLLDKQNKALRKAFNTKQGCEKDLPPRLRTGATAKQSSDQGGMPRIKRPKSKARSRSRDGGRYDFDKNNSAYSVPKSLGSNPSAFSMDKLGYKNSNYSLPRSKTSSTARNYDNHNCLSSTGSRHSLGSGKQMKKKATRMLNNNRQNNFMVSESEEDEGIYRPPSLMGERQLVQRVQRYLVDEMSPPTWSNSDSPYLNRNPSYDCVNDRNCLQK